MFRTRTPLWWLGGCVLVYAAAGALLLPYVAKPRLELAAQEQFGRELRVESLGVNPFSLSVSANDAVLADRDGSSLFEVAELYANLELWPLLWGEVVLSELRLTAPTLALRVLESGELSCADLFTSDDDTGEPPAGDGLGVHLELLRIEAGRIDFTDASHLAPFQKSLQSLDFSLRDIGTRPNARATHEGRFSLGDRDSLSFDGSISFDTMRASGHIALQGVELRGGWQYLQDQLGFELREGNADLSFEYEVSAADDPLDLRLSKGLAALRDLEIVDREGEPVLQLPELKLEGFEASLAGRSLRAAKLTSNAAKLNIRREANGDMRFQAFLPASDQQGLPEAGGDETQPAWQVELASIQFSDYGIRFEDRTLADALTLEISPVSLQVSNLSTSQGDPRSEVKLTASLAGSALHLEGSLGLDPLAGDFAIEAQALDLTQAQPYLSELSSVELLNATAGLEGRLSLNAPFSTSPQVRYEGSLQIDDLRTRDSSQQSRLLHWSSLRLQGMQLDVEPPAVKIDELLIDGAELHITVGPDGEVNLAQLGRPEAGGHTNEAPPATSPNDSTLPLEIGLLKLEGGAVQFTDLAIEPNYRSDVSALKGEIRGLSSRTGHRAEVEFSADVDGTATLKIQGTSNLMAADASTDIELELQGFGLQRLSPYSGRYAGLRINQGNLDLDLAYHLEAGTLAGTNKLRIDQLEFGDAVESEDATSLPVRLAAGLLYNGEGEILLDLPIRGKIDDPNFSVGSALLGAVTNLITRTVSSPIGWVGDPVGSDGDELSFVNFEAGNATLQATEVDKLTRLATALSERPKIVLEIRGAAERRADGKQFRKAALAAQLLVPEATAGPGGSEAERLRALYISTFDEAPEELLASRPSAAEGESAEDAGDAQTDAAWLDNEVEGRLLARIEISDARLADLATHRARVVGKRLVELGVPRRRVLYGELRIETGRASATVRTNFELRSDRE